MCDMPVPYTAMASYFGSLLVQETTSAARRHRLSRAIIIYKLLAYTSSNNGTIIGPDGWLSSTTE